LPLKLQTRTNLKWKHIFKFSERSGKIFQVRSPLLRLSTSFLRTSPEYPRIQARIAEGEAKRNKRNLLETLLANKIRSVTYPMQELELNYPTTKGKVYSEEEDRYLLCRLNYHGMDQENVYELIKRDISEFPVFRFDWFFKSRSPQELQRRCNTLLSMLEKEADAEEKRKEEAASSKSSVSAKGKVRSSLFRKWQYPLILR
jgi:SWI/SNF-related matrix-associated actin-dependent regulator of chromatin subfamily A member 5